uniref:ATP synthase complex subunit 8 n=1 Tax=Promecognathus crassus TaxID=63953 RepID=S4SUK4_9CARA|nr:ATP synthase F0 subunit 8 [Promecognathus crassus]
MPQMAPMSWLFLYFMFTIIFFMINFLNYYMYLIKNSSNNKIMKKINFKNLIWKW